MNGYARYSEGPLEGVVDSEGRLEFALPGPFTFALYQFRV